MYKRTTVPIDCPVDNCHMSGLGFVMEGLEDQAKQQYIEQMTSEHKAGKHDTFNDIINSEPVVSKRDWSRL
jgi:hypothetical protein